MRGLAQYVRPCDQSAIAIARGGSGPHGGNDAAARGQSGDSTQRMHGAGQRGRGGDGMQNCCCGVRGNFGSDEGGGDPSGE